MHQMAPLCTMGKKLAAENKTEKPDFSSIINFLGADIRKDKKRRRGDAEKKRRDRINKCLDQLEELIPYVRQKKLCSKVDKAEVLELTVHFVKETLFEKELTFRKSHLSSAVDYERMKWLAPESNIPDYEKTSSVVARKHIKCNCGCSDSLDKRANHTEHVSPSSTYSHVSPSSTYSHASPSSKYSHVSPSSSYSSYHSPPAAHITSPLHRKEF